MKISGRRLTNRDFLHLSTVPLTPKVDAKYWQVLTLMLFGIRAIDCKIYAATFLIVP